jgi:transketolase
MSASLSYLPVAEIQRITQAIADPYPRCQVLADLCRINTLYMVAYGGSGHLGSSFSSMDLFAWLWSQRMVHPNDAQVPGHDVFFSSKGHDAPGLYSVLTALGKLPETSLHTLRQLHGLPGHPDVKTPFIATNTGSLGMGVSKARGMAKARRLSGQSGHFYVLTGDGELQEGQFWESLQPTLNGEYSNITVIVDHNKFQSDTWVSRVSDLGDLERKFSAYGWAVARCDGHDLRAVERCLGDLAASSKPGVLIADTIKGKGVSFMEAAQLPQEGREALYRYHSGAPSPDDYERALTELVSRINETLSSLGQAPVALLSRERPSRPTPQAPQKLVAAYGEALRQLGERHERLVVLDGDLMVDCGLLPFRESYPERFVECGIAEQDMVSMAGGLALEGYLPVVHSFSCFLSTRPNEQIFNNATEHTKVIYAGSLAGLVPSGPGHSHQSVRDIALMGCIPGLTAVEPATETQAQDFLRWAVEENSGSTYIRLISIPIDVPFSLPQEPLRVGQGQCVRLGRDGLLIAYGPVMLAQAYRAAEELSDTQGAEVAVVNFPWLNRVDGAWLAAQVQDQPWVMVLDNHVHPGGVGSLLGNQLAGLGLPKLPRFEVTGLSEVPVCGLNHEVLAHYGFDVAGLIQRITALGAVSQELLTL